MYEKAFNDCLVANNVYSQPPRSNLGYHMLPIKKDRRGIYFELNYTTCIGLISSKTNNMNYHRYEHKWHRCVQRRDERGQEGTLYYRGCYFMLSRPTDEPFIIICGNSVRDYTNVENGTWCGFSQNHVDYALKQDLIGKIVKTTLLCTLPLQSDVCRMLI